MVTMQHRVLDKPLMAFSVPEEIAKIKQGEQWKHARRGAVTLSKNADLRMVLVVLSQGMEIHEHHAEGPITVYVVEGSIKFHAADEELTLPAGSLLSLGGGIPHDVHALDECAFIITVIQPHGAA
jgi:quercetin dioxygenase-like cupin family protein